MNTSPFSIRLNPATDALIRDIAIREGRSRSKVAADLLEESARIRRFPGVGFRGGSSGRRAYVQGSFMDVWQIVESVNAFGSIEDAVECTHLSERQVRLALAYYDAFAEEVDRRIKENQASLENVQNMYPGLISNQSNGINS